MTFKVLPLVVEQLRHIVREPVAIKGVPWDFSAEIVTLI